MEGTKDFQFWENFFKNNKINCDNKSKQDLYKIGIQKLIQYNDIELKNYIKNALNSFDVLNRSRFIKAIKSFKNNQNIPINTDSLLSINNTGNNIVVSKQENDAYNKLLKRHNIVLKLIKDIEQSILNLDDIYSDIEVQIGNVLDDIIKRIESKQRILVDNEVDKLKNDKWKQLKDQLNVMNEHKMECAKMLKKYDQSESKKYMVSKINNVLDSKNVFMIFVTKPKVDFTIPSLNELKKDAFFINSFDNPYKCWISIGKIESTMAKIKYCVFRNDGNINDDDISISDIIDDYNDMDPKSKVTQYELYYCKYKDNVGNDTTDNESDSDSDSDSESKNSSDSESSDMDNPFKKKKKRKKRKKKRSKLELKKSSKKKKSYKHKMKSKLIKKDEINDDYISKWKSISLESHKKLKKNKYILENLSKNQSYLVKIRGNNEFGNGIFSNIYWIHTDNHYSTVWDKHNKGAHVQIKNKGLTAITTGINQIVRGKDPFPIGTKSEFEFDITITGPTNYNFVGIMDEHQRGYDSQSIVRPYGIENVERYVYSGGQGPNGAMQQSWGAKSIPFNVPTRIKIEIDYRNKHEIIMKLYHSGVLMMNNFEKYSFKINTNGNKFYPAVGMMNVGCQCKLIFPK